MQFVDIAVYCLAGEVHNMDFAVDAHEPYVVGSAHTV
jgi:hypothetical protein